MRQDKGWHLNELLQPSFKTLGRHENSFVVLCELIAVIGNKIEIIFGCNVIISSQFLRESGSSHGHLLMSEHQMLNNRCSGFFRQWLFSQEKFSDFLKCIRGPREEPIDDCIGYQPREITTS